MTIMYGKKLASLAALFVCGMNMAHALVTLPPTLGGCDITNGQVLPMNITLPRRMSEARIGEELGSRMVLDYEIKCENPKNTDDSYPFHLEWLYSVHPSGGETLDHKEFPTNVPGVAMEFLTINTTDAVGHPDLVQNIALFPPSDTGSPLYRGVARIVDVLIKNDRENNIYPNLYARYKIVATLVKTSDEADSKISSQPTSIVIPFHLSLDLSTDPSLKGYFDTDNLLDGAITLAARNPETAAAHALHRLKTAHPQFHPCQAGGKHAAGRVCQRTGSSH